MSSPLGLRLDPNDTLQTFAEVSVALAGFIGITAAFRRRDSSSWSTYDINSVRFVLEVSFAALFLSVLPAIIVNLGVAEAPAWQVAGGLMSLTLVALFIYQSHRRRRMEQELGSTRSLEARPYLLALYVVITALIAISSALDIAVTGAYLIGVSMLLASAAIEFLAFVAGLQDDG